MHRLLSPALPPLPAALLGLLLHLLRPARS
jgi:hypothetical protein